MKYASPITFCLSLFIALSPEAQELESDEAAINRVDAEMVTALNTRDVGRWLSHFVDDAEMWPPCAPRIVGKDEIRHEIELYLASPTFVVAHHIEKVVVAKSADLAYVTYTYEMGDPVTEAGKDVTLYRRDNDGAWKVAIDMWNTDAPPCG